MTKFMDKVYKGASWIIMGALLLAYFAFMVLDFNGSIQNAINDWRTWLHLVFVIFLNVTMVSTAYDAGIQAGIMSEEYTLADTLNNQLIVSINNNMEEFRNYTKKINEHELRSMQEDYLFSIGDKKVEELSKRELKKYNKLKPIRHNIYGFNLPLFYEASRGGKVNYQASQKATKGKTWRQFKKALMGLLFGGMTVNVSFAFANVGDALVSVMIIAVGLIVTYLTAYYPQLFNYKVNIPKRVILKKTFYDSFEKYQNGKVILKKELKPIDIVEEEKEQ